MAQKISVASIAVIAVLVLSVRVQAGPMVDYDRAAGQEVCNAPRAFPEQVGVGMREVLGNHSVVQIPEERRNEPVTLLGRERGVAGVGDLAPAYYNTSSYWYGVRVPDELSPPYWLAEDIQLFLLGDVTEWEIKGYSFTTFAFDGTAPYTVTARLYRFDVCSSTPTPLIDLTTSDCCADPVEIAGTAANFTIPSDGMVEVTHNLPTPVVVDKNIFMYLEYSGANVAGNAGWVIAGPAEVGLTENFWAEDIWNANPPPGLGCGLHSFGGDPYAGFAAAIWSEPEAVMEMIPEGASGAHTIRGSEILLDCGDLPQCVQLAVYARDWDLEDAGILVDGWDTRIGCESYDSAPAGTLTAVATCCITGPCDLCTIGVDRTRSDYIFPPAEFIAGC